MRPARSRAIASLTSSALSGSRSAVGSSRMTRARVAEEGPGKRDPTTLACRQRPPAVADERLVPSRENTGRKCRRRRAPQPAALARPRPTNRRAECCRRSCREAAPDAAAPTRGHDAIPELGLGEIDPADADSTRRRLEQPQEQPRDGALARAARAHERHRLARPEFELETVEDEPRPRRVGKRDALEEHGRLGGVGAIRPPRPPTSGVASRSANILSATAAPSALAWNSAPRRRRG